MPLTQGQTKGKVRLRYFPYENVQDDFRQTLLKVIRWISLKTMLKLNIAVITEKSAYKVILRHKNKCHVQIVCLNTCLKIPPMQIPLTQEFITVPEMVR